MKTVFKCGSIEKNLKAEKFFCEKILPILNEEIAIELAASKVRTYQNNGIRIVEPVVEISVELPMDVILKAKDLDFPEEKLKDISGHLHDEALAIRKIEKLNPFFSREYYICAYSQGSWCKVD